MLKRLLHLLPRADLEDRVEECRRQRTLLSLEEADLLGRFRPLSPSLKELRAALRARRRRDAREALLDHFHTRPGPVVFLHESQRPALASLRDTLGEDGRSALREAEEATSHRFAPLGVEPRAFPASIDWFSDFQGRSWVCAHVEDLRDQFAGRLPAPSVEMGSVAVTWEFNRHAHFVSLGRAYWLTGRERFASEFIVQVVDWTERNPALEGVNWLDPETVAARCVHWLAALQMFLSSPQLTADLLVRILGSLILHGAVLAHRLRQEEGPGLLAAASGLAVLAWSLPELEEAERWKQRALSAMARAAARELGREGLHRSGSLAAHREATEWLLLPLILHRLAGAPLPRDLEEAAQAACEALAHLRSPNGFSLELGRAAGRGFLGRGCGPAEHTRRVLALGAVITGRGDLRQVAGELPGELYWWLGPSAVDRYRALVEHQPGNTCRLFAEVGVACARDGWGRKASWCALRGSPPVGKAEDRRVVPGGEPDFHDDSLSLAVTLEGEPVLLEPGVPPRPGRMQRIFSRLAAHSAVRVRGEREPLAEGDPASRDLRLEERRCGVYLAAARQVWMEPDRPWPLHREILFLPGEKRLVIRDRLEGMGEALVEVNLLLAAHLEVLMRGDMGCLLRGKQLAARIHPVFPGPFRYHLTRGQNRPFAGWYWAECGAPRATHRLVYLCRAALPASFYLWIGWDPTDPAAPRGVDLDRLFQG